MPIKGKSNSMVKSSNYLNRISRTLVNNDFNFRTTFSVGSLFPIYASEVLPGENKKIYCGELVRSITPLGPVMDNSFIDIFFFFVPKRLLWDHWEEFIAGYNKEAWAQDVEYTVPKIIFKNIGTAVDGNKYSHSFLDYLPGACDIFNLADWQATDLTIMTDAEKTSWRKNFDLVFAIDALYPRSYVKIWNDWFRDENLQDELELYTGDNNEYADDFCFDLLNRLSLPKACKYHNRFTTALPSPVKGPDVLIPMSNLAVGPFGSGISSGSEIPDDTDGGFMVTGDERLVVGADEYPVYAKNVSNTIRMLRLATQTELLLACDARGGTRYVESLLSHFGVHNGDARLQRSEYLGSKQIPLQMSQVTNTAGTAGSPLGNVGGQSVTRDNSFYFSKGFTEHGIVLGVACVRTNLSYSSGIRKQYQRFTRFDHIWPEFKHIGDVPLYTRELSQDINLDGNGDDVFGYTPYGSELREGYNYNNGLFRPSASGSLSYLTYQESYEDGVPFLGSLYIEQPDVVSDTLTLQSGPQYYALFQIHEERIIPLDPTSDPGLMDHF